MHETEASGNIQRQLLASAIPEGIFCLICEERAEVVLQAGALCLILYSGAKRFSRIRGIHACIDAVTGRSVTSDEAVKFTYTWHMHDGKAQLSAAAFQDVCTG